MALKIYTDAAATIEASPTEYFTGDGSSTAFALTKFAGSTVTAVYKETKVSITGCTADAGVITTGSITMTANQYVGYAAYHQSFSGDTIQKAVFRGYVTANTAVTGAAGTITLDTTDYTSGAADTLILVKDVKQSAVTQYSITGNTINFVAAPASLENIYAIGSTPISLNFGGNFTAGTDITSAVKLYLKREPGYVYGDIQINSDNLSQTASIAPFVNVDYASGVGTLHGDDEFNGVMSEVGKAVNHDGVFKGVIVSNTAKTFTLDTLTFTYDHTAVGQTDMITSVYTVGELLIAPDDNGGSQPADASFAKVLQGHSGDPADVIDSNTVYPFWIKATVPLPSAPTNYAENIILISASEYLE